MPSGYRAASVASLAFAPDGRRLAAVGADGTARLWDADTGHELHALGKHQVDVASVAAAPDGRRLAIGAYDGTVRLWDAETGVELLTLRGHTGAVRTVSFAPDGRRVASEGTTARSGSGTWKPAVS